MRKLTIVLFVILLLSGCAQTVDVSQCVSGERFGFLSGLFDGLVIVISFIISLFDHSITIWETNNNGGWYHFGFVLGVAISARYSIEELRDLIVSIYEVLFG